MGYLRSALVLIIWILISQQFPVRRALVVTILLSPSITSLYPRTQDTLHQYCAAPMSRPRSAQGLHRVRTNSQSHIESAISAIQQSESLARETAAASAGFVPGTGGFIGGPPVPSTSPIAASAVGVSRARGASVRHRKDPTLALWNGKRVRTNDRICKDVSAPRFSSARQDLSCPT